MNDLIIREEALEKIKKYYITFGLTAQSAWTAQITWNECIDVIAEAISELPSANQWISVSERLPEETIKVLVQADDMYYNMNNNTGILIGWRNENKWSTLTTKGCESIRYPIAWMPLPKPYEKKE